MHFHFGGLGTAIVVAVLLIAAEKSDRHAQHMKLEWAKFCLANPMLKHEKCNRG